MTIADNGTRPRHAVTLLIVTYLCVRAFWSASAAGGPIMEVASVEAAMKVAIWLPACALTVWLMNRRRGVSVLSELGMGPGLIRGLAMGAAATIPMLVAVTLLPTTPLDPDLIAGSAIIGPLAEELLFRGFLFRQLVKRAGWPVLPAVIVSSVFFGFAHLPMLWSSLPYSLGGAVFAWMTYRWKSLWPAIALHGCMNFWWDLSSGEHVKLYVKLVFRTDPVAAAQALSIVLAVWLTVVWTRPRLTRESSVVAESVE